MQHGKKQQQGKSTSDSAATITRKITPAQDALLSFASHLEAGSLFTYLNTTLGLSIARFAGSDESNPTAITTNAWYFTLELLQRLHDISVEDPNTGDINL
ncbi:MAG: hypothetical protein JNM22_05690 [Saprospiraceae bacterium]|nr:hypothetical protein [Saprospiraceae bacterium]